MADISRSSVYRRIYGRDVYRVAVSPLDVRSSCLSEIGIRRHGQGFRCSMMGYYVMV